MASKPQKAILRPVRGEISLDRLLSLLMEAGKVKVSHFGVFEIRHLPSYKVQHNLAGRKITVKDRLKLAFRPSITIKRFIKKNYGK